MQQAYVNFMTPRTAVTSSYAGAEPVIGVAKVVVMNVHN
jgi:hypothetical protein